MRKKLHKNTVNSIFIIKKELFRERNFLPKLQMPNG